MGARARNGIPGGVVRDRDHCPRFRAMIEILGALSSVFGVLKPFLPKIDSMQTMQVDIKYH